MFKMPTAVVAALVAGLMVEPACSNSALKSRAGDAGAASGGQAGSSIRSGTPGGLGGSGGASMGRTGGGLASSATSSGGGGNTGGISSGGQANTGGSAGAGGMSNSGGRMAPQVPQEVTVPKRASMRASLPMSMRTYRCFPNARWALFSTALSAPPGL